MSLSRAQPLLRLTSSSLKNFLKNNNWQFKQHVRTKTFYQYRNSDPPEEFMNIVKPLYQGFGAVVWWFIIWRAAMEYEEVIGPKLPDMTEWTDEELGVPPLEEDP